MTPYRLRFCNTSFLASSSASLTSTVVHDFLPFTVFGKIKSTSPLREVLFWFVANDDKKKYRCAFTQRLKKFFCYCPSLHSSSEANQWAKQRRVSKFRHESHNFHLPKKLTIGREYHWACQHETYHEPRHLYSPLFKLNLDSELNITHNGRAVISKILRPSYHFSWRVCSRHVWNPQSCPKYLAGWLPKNPPSNQCNKNS